jgi:hypothetical protein
VQYSDRVWDTHGLVMLIKMCLNKNKSKVRIGKHLSEKFHNQNGLKQGDALSPVLFIFDIRNFQEDEVELKLNGIYQLLVCVYDVNLLGDDLDTIKKNTHFNDASKEVGLEVNTEKTKYMLLSRHQNAGQNHDIKIGNRCFENVAQFKT